MADNNGHLETRIARLREAISLNPQNASLQRLLDKQLYKQRGRHQAQVQMMTTSHTSTRQTLLASPQTPKSSIACLRDRLSEAETRQTEAEAIVAGHAHVLEHLTKKVTEASLSSNFKVCHLPIKVHANINVDIESGRPERNRWTPNQNAGRSQF